MFNERVFRIEVIFDLREGRSNGLKFVKHSFILVRGRFIIIFERDCFDGNFDFDDDEDDDNRSWLDSNSDFGFDPYSKLFQLGDAVSVLVIGLFNIRSFLLVTDVVALRYRIEIGRMLDMIKEVRDISKL